MVFLNRHDSSAGRWRRPVPSMIIGWVLLTLPAIGGARSDQTLGGRLHNRAAAAPTYCHAAHNVGRIVLTVGNHGVFGTGLALGNLGDCFTGEYLPSCRYPRGTQNRYLWSGTLWVGAIVNGDTLVSTGADGQLPGGNEFHPENEPVGSLEYRSTMNPAFPVFDGAISEQDYIAAFSDTCSTCVGLTNDPQDDRPHRPLGLKIRQHSYAWSYLETEDIVLLDYTLENIGPDRLDAVYFGMFVDADVFALDGETALGFADDHSGFIRSVPHPLVDEPCRPVVDINTAWTADDDGDFDGLGLVAAIPGIFGICPVGGVGDEQDVSFNWWHRDPTFIRDFGPQARASFRLFADGGLGVPVGDRDKYHMLSNREQDYNQVRTATISGTDSIWLPPPFEVWSLAAGSDTRFLLSVGPYDLDPGASQQVALAVMVGDRFHTSPFCSVYLPHNPERYLEGLDFEDLIRNAVTAGYLYDNPGVDTDGDGYRGEFVECEGDTVWYRGDGRPDRRAALTPPPPELRVEPIVDGLHLTWNGAQSETLRHFLTGQPVFEGYAAYLALDSVASAFARVATYDLEDYRRYAWRSAPGDWEQAESRLSVADAICRYAPLSCDDPAWHPLDYTRQAPFVMPGSPDSVFYFEPLGPNAARFGIETPFVRSYPDVSRPAYATPDQVPSDSVSFYLTDDGNFKYYEYEYTIHDLLPGVTYWAAVTAFDYGSQLPHALPLESPLLAVAASPLYADPACCEGLVGDADCDGDDVADIADVAALIDFLFLGGPPPCCPAESDVNQTGGAIPTVTDITLSDVALLISHLFITGEPLSSCQ